MGSPRKIRIKTMPTLKTFSVSPIVEPLSSIVAVIVATKMGME